MNSKNKGKKRSNPYLKLAVFTIASASVINAYNRVKNFVSEKSEAVSEFVRERIDKMKNK
ncbi:MAG: hypothetical protein J6Q85_04670 [Clostridia bacterium]|nr:hypothetical protein [Clostridia bacterium]